MSRQVIITIAVHLQCLLLAPTLSLITHETTKVRKSKKKHKKQKTKARTM